MVEAGGVVIVEVALSGLARGSLVVAGDGRLKMEGMRFTSILLLYPPPLDEDGGDWRCEKEGHPGLELGLEPC